MKKVNLKKALDILGFKVVQYHKNYNYRSGFMRKKDNNQLYYFSFEDLRSNPTLMIRTVDEIKVDKQGKFNDWIGGRNEYPIGLNNQKSIKHGFEIYEPRLEKYDYNKK